MLKKIVFMVCAAFAFQLAFAADAEPATSSYLDGQWEGALRDLEPAAGGKTELELKVRLHIAGKKAQVFTAGEDGKWSEVKPGKFNVFQRNFSAVVLANDSWDGDCWDETWSFTVALDNANQLVTRFGRAVSNVRCMSAKAESFGRARAGVLHQQPADDSAVAH
ncbi:hypothetical protein GJ699_25685 [Duganella sp. FT80W]|uniref:Uncharacterized protein n=1 Tax=Duganella guangzhouensis TaxID=2666084 RepID=A0A6I2L9L5_9BURK|nr:hypothetical protein [Duganella guangzhouensis]MRW93386.1 hypothetical protein [Duganella guangzhouensis]